MGGEMANFHVTPTEGKHLFPQFPLQKHPTNLLLFIEFTAEKAWPTQELHPAGEKNTWVILYSTGIYGVWPLQLFSLSATKYWSRWKNLLFLTLLFTCILKSFIASLACNPQGNSGIHFFCSFLITHSGCPIPNSPRLCSCSSAFLWTQSSKLYAPGDYNHTPCRFIFISVDLQGEIFTSFEESLCVRFHTPNSTMSSG